MKKSIISLFVIAAGVLQSFAKGTLDIPAATYELSVTPGKLKSQLLDLDADVINGVILKGTINGEDLKYLTSSEGRAASITYVSLADVSFAYDGTVYKTVVDAPPGGMGTTYTYQYCFSESNYDEGLAGGPMNVNTKCYRNDLSAAFFKNTKIENVVLPKSITAIGARMFEQCENLKAVEMPDNLTAVGNLAFYYCSNLTMYDFPATFEEIGSRAFAGVKLGNVKFNKKVRLGEGAFENSSIQKLEMPLPGDSIPDLTFAYCSDLKEVIIGEGLKYIGYEAFKYDTSLSDAQLPASLSEVGVGAFYGCSFVDNIAPEDGICYIGKIAYAVKDDSRNEYTIKDGTVSLAPNVFSFNQATKYNMPSTIEIIGEEAFACTPITSMPDMPNLKRINHGAFRNCQNLGKITIPESVEYIANAFYDCNALWSVTYNAIDADCTEYGLSLRDLERIVIGDKVRRLPRGLYTGNTNITEVILPSSIEILDPGVFEGCINLEYVRLADNITTISENAFYDCRTLANIHWPVKLKNIGSNAFRECKSLKTISLPEGMECVESSAFFWCDNVENLYIASTITELGQMAFCLMNNDKNITITTTAVAPLEYEWNWHYLGTPTIKVPAASLAAYQADNNWNGAINGKNNLIVAIEGISASSEDSETSFGSGIDDETDLGDTVIGDVYVTLGEDDGYDAADGSIVLNSTMDEEYVDAVGGMAPGESDIANRFNGLVVMVPAGKGSITVNCLTIGDKRVAVKFGEEVPEYYTKDSKGEISIEYNVTKDTYVYIYASESDNVQKIIRKSSPVTRASDSYIKIYSIGIKSENSGIDDIEIDDPAQSPIVEYYNIDGSKVDSPVSGHIYICRRANGTYSKILIK